MKNATPYLIALAELVALLLCAAVLVAGVILLSPEAAYPREPDTEDADWIGFIGGGSLIPLMERYAPAALPGARFGGVDLFWHLRR